MAEAIDGERDTGDAKQMLPWDAHIDASAVAFITGKMAPAEYADTFNPRRGLAELFIERSGRSSRSPPPGRPNQPFEFTSRVDRSLEAITCTRFPATAS